MPKHPLFYTPFEEAALIADTTNNMKTLVQLDVPHEFQIISDEDENGQLMLSIRRIQYRQAWDKATRL